MENNPNRDLIQMKSNINNDKIKIERKFKLSKYTILFILFIFTSIVIGLNYCNNIKEKFTLENKFCSISSAEDLLAFSETNKYENKIPKIIHYVYKTSYIPSQYVHHVYNCMQVNEDAKFVFWSDFTAYRFVIKHFPHHFNTYKSYFDKKSDSLKISDVIRYFILYKFGGIYMDLDTSCLKPFESVFTNGSCIFSREIEEQSRILYNYNFITMNSFMACIPKHRFFSHLINHLSKSQKTHILKQTGPLFITDQLNTYLRKFNAFSLYDPAISVVVADSYLFSPFSESSLELTCKERLVGYWRKRGCEDLPRHRNIQKIKIKDAVVIHLFLHLGYKEHKGLIIENNNICLTFEYLTLIW